MPEHSAEFLRGALAELEAWRYVCMITLEDRMQDYRSRIAESEASEATHPTAADVIAEAKKALELSATRIWHAAACRRDEQDGVPCNCGQSKTEALIYAALDKLAAWEAAQNAR